MSHFEQKFIDQIKQKLGAEETRLARELEQITTKKPRAGEPRASFPNLGDKEDENAAEVAAYSDILTIERALESALRDVRGALKRIKEDKYGICKYCSQPISEPRLLARPVSSACIDCKKMLTQEV